MQKNKTQKYKSQKYKTQKYKTGQIVYTVAAILSIGLLYMVIFIHSAMSGAESSIKSMTVTERIITMVETVFSVELPFNDSPEQIDRLDGAVRKGAHFGEYALLGILTFSIPLCWGVPPRRWAAGSFLLVVILAAADEFHQTFVPGRAGSPADVLLDSSGCLAGMLLLNWFWGIFSRRHKNYIRRRSVTARSR